MNIEAKRIELYREFRQFSNLSDEGKVDFKAKIANEASQRTGVEKATYRQAMLANVLEIKEKLLEMKVKIDKNLVVSA